MSIKKRILIFLILVIVGLNVIFIGLWIKEKRKNSMIIKVEGFEIEYNSSSRKVTTEMLDDIELGSSIYEISNKFGEPDEWIGSGILRPVYFLEDNSVVVFHFEYPAVCKDLKQVVLYRENGESQVIKEK